jgi:peptidoglycan/xylan/chitin deacetylase (PgdA/CDA1 family)
MARQSLKEPYTIRSGDLFQDFETVGDWTAGGTGASIVADTDLYKTGTQSIKLMTGVGSTGNLTRTINETLTDIGVLSYWVYVEDVTKVNGLTIMLSNNNTFTDYFSFLYLANNDKTTKLHNGWNLLTVGKQQWTANGSANWANPIIRVRLSASVVGANQGVLWFDSIVIRKYTRPKVIFTFDDGSSSIYSEGFSYLDSKGIQATSYINSSTIDTAGFQTSAQLLEMYNAGWDISNHTEDGTDLTTLTQAQMESSIRSCSEFISAAGMTRRNCHRHVAYPGGFYNDVTLSAMAATGMITGRTVREGVESVPLDDVYTIGTRQIVNTTTLAVAKGYVTQAIGSGGTLVLLFHKIVAVPVTTLEWSISDFQDLVDYIDLLRLGGVLDTMTMTEWYDGLTQSRSIATSRAVATNRRTVRNMGTALRFDGVNDNVVLPIGLNTHFSKSNTGACTLSMFLNVGNVNTASNCIYISIIDTNDRFAVSVGVGYLRFGIFNGATWQSGSGGYKINSNTWYKLDVVISNGIITAGYLNGVLASPNGSFTPQTATTAGVRFGERTDGTQDLLGAIDEARIWSRALSATEVQNLYLYNDVPRNGLVAEYLFNEGSGTTATDSSGNGNNGTITGATYVTDAPLKTRVVV